MRGGRANRERGTISLYTVLLTPAVLLLVGLVFDGGKAIHARQRAADIAEQAARAGANEIDVASLRGGDPQPRIDRTRACGRALDFLAEYPGELAPDRDCGYPGGEEVEVTVTIVVRPQLLNLVPGFGEFRMTSTASAHPDDGNP